jgi:hypothetical protein
MRRRGKLTRYQSLQTAAGFSIQVGRMAGENASTTPGNAKEIYADG